MNDPLYNVNYIRRTDTNKIAIKKGFKNAIHDILLEYAAITDDKEKREYIKKFE